MVMTREQAQTIAGFFREIGGFTKIEVEQAGGEFAAPTNPWRVLLWSVNARAGNRNLTSIENAEEVPNVAAAKRLARVAKGKATERDRAALARIAQEKEEERGDR